ncbi:MULTISPECIES: hypothetical protein [unclassified Caulobacter]|uniref:hypothetical protein n=1 Tax=unclassified Caulobacter TaxID=2648921 RepID=UPI000D38DF09|nr:MULTISPECIES: hypothetical protein [unclassified Caulobacter]PTS87387.1 hypothetical protein DBR21_12715 [Caulobacter sp. HMWF009]PTT86205.1 hypothetical protein DBR41_01175 [Pseudomonas sp. HMWF010]
MKMTDDEIRLDAARKLAADRQGLPTNPEGPPAEITPAILAFCQSLSPVMPQYLALTADPLGRYGWCNEGVRLKVATAGGEPVHGWNVVEWPPGLLTAEFHCVWKSPEGELIEMTPKPWPWGRILFVEDPNYPADFNFEGRPRNRRHRTYEPVAREARLHAQIDAMTESQRAYEEGRAAKAGLSLTAWLDRKAVPDVLVSAIDEFIALCQDFEAHYDSLGASGSIRADAKFIALATRRQALQPRLRQLMGLAVKGQVI